MSSFYVKTFLRFCALTLVLTLTTTAVYFAFFYENPHASPNRPLFNSYAFAAVSVYEHAGEKALSDWLSQLQKDRNVNIYVLNEKGYDILNRELPSYVRKTLKQRGQIQGSEPPHFVAKTKSLKKHHLTFTPVVSSQNKNYFVITDLPPLKHAHLYSPSQNLGLRLLTVIIIGGLITAWITWYLTRPVSQLRKATQEWSSGNLSARVGENLGNRHDELAVLGRELDLMAERLQTLMENQQRLLSDISHELRTPLARLQIALGLARQRTGKAAEPELNRIELEAERLNEMIGQILSLVRLGAATEADNKEKTDIVDLLNVIINNAQFENGETEKKGYMVAQENIPKIQVNSQLIYSALENIIRNAFRYAPHNTAIEINVALSKTLSNMLEITVRDRGPGVPQEKLDQIFEPFFRVDNARERDKGGYGLGLTIVKRAIEIHSGKVSAENAVDGGLIVRILLPIK